MSKTQQYKFENLKVWQESMKLISLVYSVTEKMPSNEKYNLNDQIRRSVVSVSLNIAEGCGSQNDIEFKRYLFIAKKSLFEVLATLKIIGGVYNIKTNEAEIKVDQISKLLSGLINYLKNSQKSHDSRLKTHD